MPKCAGEVSKYFKSAGAGAGAALPSPAALLRMADPWHCHGVPSAALEREGLGHLAWKRAPRVGY